MRKIKNKRKKSGKNKKKEKTNRSWSGRSGSPYDVGVLDEDVGY